ncbi:hypothetical protein Taro_038782 [Colocasia esculenta]|uniref:RNase H type-1 domain-containing protein n=1 Tax=Colocasia esculenta TaxID=4460 RepID=A0A843WPM1_COLES|nr:hypothetical protein [Colocasia esculenta]
MLSTLFLWVFPKEFSTELKRFFSRILDGRVAMAPQFDSSKISGWVIFLFVMLFTTPLPWKLWHHLIPPRAALFGWRLLHRAVPIDSRIMDCGLVEVDCSAVKCSARMEGSFRTVDSIKRTITISVLATRKAPILVKWVPPSSDYSLNVDGASKGNPGISGGGGCVRDSRGNLLCAFAFSYAISVGQAPHWAVFPWWRGICDMIRILNPKLVHTYREGNQVADSLANFACTNESCLVFSELSELPFNARGALLVDRLGLPSFRQP